MLNESVARRHADLDAEAACMSSVYPPYSESQSASSVLIAGSMTYAFNSMACPHDPAIHGKHVQESKQFKKDILEETFKLNIHIRRIENEFNVMSGELVGSEVNVDSHFQICFPTRSTITCIGRSAQIECAVGGN